MSLISQIDALPDDMKVLCGSFAYGLKIDPAYREYGPRLAVVMYYRAYRAYRGWKFRVGADVYRIEPSGWELVAWGNYRGDRDDDGERFGRWKIAACGDRKEDFLRELNIKHVGDIEEAGYDGGFGHVDDGVWRGGQFFKRRSTDDECYEDEEEDDEDEEDEEEE